MLRTSTPILRIFAVAAILLLLAVVAASTVPVPALAQTGTEVRVGELERRAAVTDVEATTARAELGKLAERLTRVEAISQNNNTLLVGVLLGISALLIERAIRIGVGKRNA